MTSLSTRRFGANSCPNSTAWHFWFPDNSSTSLGTSLLLDIVSLAPCTFRNKCAEFPTFFPFLYFPDLCCLDPHGPTPSNHRMSGRDQGSHRRWSHRFEICLTFFNIGSITHRIHVYAIYGNIYHILPSIYPSHVSIYTSTMDPMGYDQLINEIGWIPIGSRISLRNLLDSMLAELIHMSIVTTWSVGKSQANSTTTWTCRARAPVPCATRSSTNPSISTFHTHSTHGGSWRIMEDHGGSWRCMFIISYPRFPSQLAPCCSPDPGLQGLRPVVAPQLLWDVYRLLWKWAPHRTYRTETRNIHATRYLMFKNVTKGYRIVIHTLAACSTLLHLLKAPAKSHHVQHDVIPRFRIFRQVN